MTFGLFVLPLSKNFMHVTPEHIVLLETCAHLQAKHCRISNQLLFRKFSPSVTVVYRVYIFLRDEGPEKREIINQSQLCIEEQSATTNYRPCYGLLKFTAQRTWYNNKEVCTAKSKPTAN